MTPSDQELAQENLRALHLKFNYAREVLGDAAAADAWVRYEIAQAIYDENYTDGYTPDPAPLSRENQRIVERYGDTLHIGSTIDGNNMADIIFKRMTGGN